MPDATLLDEALAVVRELADRHAAATVKAHQEDKPLPEFDDAAVRFALGRLRASATPGGQRHRRIGG